MKIKYNKTPLIFKVENETLEEIASMFGLNVEVIKKTNNIKKTAKGQFLLLTQTNFYTVKPLDTFDKICQKLGVSKEYLQEKNSAKALFIGQILHY